MTIRTSLFGGTDWSDGEILYAADLNDTMGASVDADNFTNLSTYTDFDTSTGHDHDGINSKYIHMVSEIASGTHTFTETYDTVVTITVPEDGYYVIFAYAPFGMRSDVTGIIYSSNLRLRNTTPSISNVTYAESKINHLGYDTVSDFRSYCFNASTMQNLSSGDIIEIQARKNSPDMKAYVDVFTGEAKIVLLRLGA